MTDIQKRALASIEDRSGKIAYGFESFSESHKEKAYRQLEVLRYLRKLVEKDMEELCQK